MPENDEARRARRRTYYARNRERVKQHSAEWQHNNRETVNRSRQKRYRARSEQEKRALGLWKYHRMRPEEWSTMWEAQQGLCYLCDGELDPEKAIVEHDHSCCPRDHSCHICRRGLAHQKCNSMIGLGDDDPDRLRRMADALEVAQAIVKQRKADIGEEIVLFAI